MFTRSVNVDPIVCLHPDHPKESLFFGIPVYVIDDASLQVTLGKTKDDACYYCQNSCERYTGREEDGSELAKYLLLGHIFLEACRYKQCIKHYSEALKLASRLGDQKSKVYAYFNLGKALRFTGESESSRKYYLKAFALATLIADKSLQKDAYRRIGHLYYDSGKFNAALELYLKAHEISFKLGKRKEEAKINLRLANTFFQLKENETAIAFFQEVIDFGNELEDQEIKMKAFQGLGTLYLNSASDLMKDCDYEEAIKSYEKALNVSRTECCDHHDQGLLQEKALAGLGVAWFNLGDAEKAIERLREARALIQKSPFDAGKYFIQVSIRRNRDYIFIISFPLCKDCNNFKFRLCKNILVDNICLN